MMKPIAAISTPGGTAATAVDAAIGAAAAAGSAADASAGVVPGAAAGSSVTSTAATSVINSVLVVDRLYDPRVACSTDPETGEEVLLSLQPSEQQPLLTGQRYCRSVVVTSTLAAERDLQILVQVRGLVWLEVSAAVANCVLAGLCPRWARRFLLQCTSSVLVLYAKLGVCNQDML
jgi:hypothetical protein